MVAQIGPSFAGHQPVVFNPMVPPMQSPHGYVQPNGPQVWFTENMKLWLS